MTIKKLIILVVGVVLTIVLIPLGFASANTESSIPEEVTAQAILANSETFELSGDIRGDIETRAALGLNADVEYVLKLRESSENVGNERFGIPLTLAELTEIEGRFAFAAAAREEVLPFVEGLPTFAGAYFDHQVDGELVILLTAVDDATRDKIFALAPAGRPTRVELVEYTQIQLREAIPTVWKTWTDAGGPKIYAIAADTPMNAIRIDVDIANLEEAAKLVNKVSDTIDIPLFVATGVQITETACTDREHCTNPMRGGIVIRRGSTSGTRCTMGFHIQVGSDEQFVTAGHCGYSGSNYWYHQGYGYVGNEKKTQYYNTGRDIMTVQIPDTQDSSILYSSSVALSTTWDPYIGEGICASRGVSSTSWKCGVVQDDYLSWFSPICGCMIYGADSSIPGVGGDSGSPIVDAYSQYIAVGIMNSSAGHFAIVDDALAAWGYQLRQ